MSSCSSRTEEDLKILLLINESHVDLCSNCEPSSELLAFSQRENIQLEVVKKHFNGNRAEYSQLVTYNPWAIALLEGNKVLYWGNAPVKMKIFIDQRKKL